MTRPTSPEAVEKRFVGKTLGEVPTPCAVLDRAKVEANCQRMLDAVEKLNIGWRAHVKSHKVSRRSCNLSRPGGFQLLDIKEAYYSSADDMHLAQHVDNRDHKVAGRRQE